MTNKHITILGGFGSVGIEAAQYLLQHSDVTITLAARTQELYLSILSNYICIV